MTPVGYNYVEVSGRAAGIAFFAQSFESFPDGVFTLTSGKLCLKANGCAKIYADFDFVGTKVRALATDVNDVIIVSNPIESTDTTSNLLAFPIEAHTRTMKTAQQPIVDIVQGMDHNPQVIKTSGMLTLFINEEKLVSRIEFVYPK